MKTHTDHRPTSLPAYFLGRPASLWMQAQSPERAKGRRRQSLLEPAQRLSERRSLYAHLGPHDRDGGSGDVGRHHHTER